MDTLQLYTQKITSALSGVGSIKISNFVEEHTRTEPLLHPHAQDTKPDISALVYSLLRLPKEILYTRTFIMGQSDAVFTDAGFDVMSPRWVSTHTPARRRRLLYHAEENICAVYIASKSDVDDLVTIVTAFYIEIIKLHQLSIAHQDVPLSEHFDANDFSRLQEALGTLYEDFLQLIQHPIDYEVKLLAGTHLDYAKAVQEWWVHLASIRKKQQVDIYRQPVYFVSSNSHSLINVLSGFSLKEKEFVLQDNNQLLFEQSGEFEKHKVPQENILYYLSRFSEKKHSNLQERKLDWEHANGLYRMHSFHHIDIEAQVFSIRDFIQNEYIDPRLDISPEKKELLLHSNALIINIAYPLGLSSYMILKEVSENIAEMRGIYIMGKAGSLNAAVGDISIPHVVHDLHTYNDIFFQNIFSPASFIPYFPDGSIFGNQKALTVLGTFLQNEASLQDALEKNLTIIEMEIGPYLNRVYEMLYPERHPLHDTFVLNPQFRLGLAYYISDTPYKKGINLGSKRLTWEGLNATYAISLGMIDDILTTEVNHLTKKRP